MKTSLYKLKEYKIIERDDGELSWEAHFGLGSLQEGRCYKRGSILFISQAENEHPGYLMLEYTDHLKRLPDWLKTNYYCTSLEINHCDSGKGVPKEEMDLWKYDRRPYTTEGMSFDFNSISLSNIPTPESSADAAYRLHRYEIIKKEKDRIFWNSCSGPVTGESGICNLLEGILFIGPRLITQDSLPKRQFLTHLNRLPKWEQTKYYCPKFVLHECKATHRNHVGQKLGREVKQILKKTGSPKNSRNDSEADMSHILAQKAYTEKRETAMQLPFEAGTDQQLFQSNQSSISENNAVFSASSIKALIIGAAGFILLIILSSIFFSSVHLIGYGSHWNYNKKNIHQAIE